MDNESPEKPEEFNCFEETENILQDESNENDINFKSIVFQTNKKEYDLYIPSEDKALFHGEINSIKHETKEIKIVKIFLNKKRLRKAFKKFYKKVSK